VTGGSPRLLQGAAWAAFLLLGACAAPQPKVVYSPLAQPTQDTGIPFQLTASRIVIAPAPDKVGELPDMSDRTLFCTPDVCLDIDPTAPASKGKVAKPVPLVAVVVPIDSVGPTLRIAPRDGRFVRTTLSPTYQMNSLRLRELSVSATDRRLQAIRAIGAVANGVVDLVRGPGNSGPDREVAALRPLPLRLPLLVDLDTRRPAPPETTAPAADGAAPSAPASPGPPGSWTASTPGSSEDWNVVVTVLASANRDSLLPADRAGEVRDALLTSSCQPAEVRLVATPPWNEDAPVARPTFVFPVVLADPSRLLAIPFPTKGAMILHPLCGADVRAEPVTEVGIDELAEAFFAQARQLRAGLAK
jgi:hypothetical protein